MTNSNPYHASTREHESRRSRRLTERIAARVLLSPVLGAISGAVTGGLAISLYFVAASIGQGKLGEVLLGSVLLFPFGFIYGLSCGLGAGLLAIPALFALRRKKLLDAGAFGIVVGTLAYFYFDSLERTATWEPSAEYLVSRVATSAVAASLNIWLLGRQLEVTTVAR